MSCVSTSYKKLSSAYGAEDNSLSLSFSLSLSSYGKLNLETNKSENTSVKNGQRLGFCVYVIFEGKFKLFIKLSLIEKDIFRACMKLFLPFFFPLLTSARKQ